MDETKSDASRSSAEAWQEVGKRLEDLGNSLASALRGAWDDEANQQALREMEAGLKSVARAVADTVDQTAASPEGQRLREDAERAAESARRAGEKAADEARPQILAALQTLREGLQAAIDQLRSKRPDDQGE